MMAIIFAVSSVHGKVINEVGLGSETYHINGHFALFVLLCFAFYKATKNVERSILLTILYSFTDEFHQKFTPGRSSSLFDIYVDSAGALLAGLCLWKLQQYLPNKLKTWLKN